MGAGQIGGIATLLDIDLGNSAGFVGRDAANTEATFLVYYFSHAMLFCTGALIEANIAVTPAMCVSSERAKFRIYGGTHNFLSDRSVDRTVEHICYHNGFNRTGCYTNNMAVIIADTQFPFLKKTSQTDFLMTRVRYSPEVNTDAELSCSMYGWGSRRNAFLVPLLKHLRVVDVTVLPGSQCDQLWNFNDSYVCVKPFYCRNQEDGSLCPDDVGSVIVCKGYLKGMMTSRALDRPCGVGFLDMTIFNKYLTCSVDDAYQIHNSELRDILDATTQPKPTDVTTASA